MLVAAAVADISLQAVRVGTAAVELEGAAIITVVQALLIPVAVAVAALVGLRLLIEQTGVQVGLVL